MKKKILLALLLILVVFAFVGCNQNGDDGGENPPSVIPPEEEPIIEVMALDPTIRVDETALAEYDYTVHFAIVENGKHVTVEQSYINKNDVPAGAGTGTVYCAYKGVSASVQVIVTTSVYELNLSKTYITVLDTEVNGYDFLSYFTAIKDGDVQVITSDMITSNVQSTLGVYEYSVTYHGITKTMTVSVDNGITVTALAESYSIRDDEILDYDYTRCFFVRKDGKYISITKDDLDISVTIDGGSVTCTYMGKSATVTIVAIPLEYRIVKLRENFVVYAGKATTFDYATLFIGYVDGVQTEIVPENLTSDIEAVSGEYTLRVTLGRTSAELPVTVTDEHVIEIIPAYTELSVREDKLESFDLSELFWLYVDEEMRDASTLLTFDDTALKAGTAGETKSLGVSCVVDDTTRTTNFNVKIVAKSQPNVTAKNAVTYPNGEKIDVLSLFTVTVDGEPVAITSDMISGTIDYLTEGLYPITLTYDGNNYVAVVEVKRGVAISIVGDPIIVSVGTDKDIYDFAGDFIVTVNGVRFRYLERYINSSSADFTTPGTYDVTISVPYVAEAGVTQDVTSVAHYKVVNKKSEVSVKEAEVRLGKGATDYNYCSNLTVYVNGVKQGFTTNEAWTDALTVYYELISEPVDFTVSGVKEVKIAVYADGVDADPITVTYDLVVYANISVEGTNKAIFSGTTIMPKDMFTVTENGDVVYPEFDCLDGKVNVFVPGVYTVSIDYKGITAESRIVVLDSVMKGVYHTKQTTTPIEEDVDEDGDIIQDATPAKIFADFIVNDDGTISFGKYVVSIVGAEDEKTVKLMIGTNAYTMYYDNGIIVLDPDNSLKMSFHDAKRPFIFVNEDVWAIDAYVQVMRGSKHVLFYQASGNYTIDAFRLISVEDSTLSKWFGLRVHLLSQMNSDTEYNVTWGEVEFATDFKTEKGTSSTLTFNGTTYTFDMTEDYIGKVDETVVKADYKYKGMRFSGTLDGVSSSVRFGNKEELTVVKGSTNLITSTAISSLRSGAYLDYDTDTLFIYDFNEKTSRYYAYKIQLNTTNKTFTVEDKDSLFGYYKYSDKFVFLDGYGTGHMAFSAKEQNPVALEYTRVGNEVNVKFADTTSAGGTSAVFYIAELLNVLTGKELKDTTLIGEQFINQIITDGAIVTMQDYSVGIGTRKEDLLKSISVVTKDGAWTESQKKSLIDLQTIKINENAFYQFTVKDIPVEGTNVTAYYVVEYTSRPYLGHALVKNYGAGICDSSTTLSIDAYGFADIKFNGVEYRGEAILNDDGTFVIKAYSTANRYLAVKGTTVTAGLISVTASGADKFTEYFTAGTIETIGASGCVLRAITIDGVTKYYMATSTATLGEEATLTLISGTGIKVAGTVFKAETATKEAYAKVNNWGDAVSGLTLADVLRGTYTRQDGAELVLDGFGNATYGAERGTYVINVRRTVTVITAENAYVFAINVDGTYRVVDIDFDESLVGGLRFTATHTFYCDDMPYIASTTFIFGGNGIVTVKSTSSEHDTGSDAVDPCAYDTYAPTFASKDGMAGTYTVSKNIVTVKVGGETFTFEITDVTVVGSIKTLSTTVESEEHGYFKVGTVFEK